MNKKLLEKVISFFLIFMVWEVVAINVGDNLIFPTPMSTLYAFLRIFNDTSSIKIILISLSRVLKSFMISFIFGVILGFIMHFYRKTRIFFSPFLRMMQTVPVMSFIMLALLWVAIDNVPVLVGLLMGLPIIASSTFKGLHSIDKKLIIMSDSFEVDIIKRLRYLYIPSIFSFLEVAMKNALSLTWKVCVAAEVLAYPKFAIGTELLNAKTFLETDKLFAWTFIIIVFGVLTEYLLKIMLKWYTKKRVLYE